MRINMAFLDDGDTATMPELVSTYDEYIFDEWGCVPEWHRAEVGKARQRGEVREIAVTVPDETIRGLFEPKPVEAKIITDA